MALADIAVFMIFVGRTAIALASRQPRVETAVRKAREREGGASDRDGSADKIQARVVRLVTRNDSLELLRLGEHIDGTAPLVIPTGRENFPSGAYRIEAILSGWNYDRFTDAERLELVAIGNPF
jgi:hypothetical protein